MRGFAIVSGLSAVAALATGCATQTTAIGGVAAPEGRAEAQPATEATELPAPGSSVPPGGGGTDGLTAEERDPHRARRLWGIVSLAIGAEAAVIAGVTSVMILHQKSIRDDNCDAQKVCNQDGKNAASTIDTIVPWNTASWIVAAVGVTAGVALVLTSQPRSGGETALTVSPALSGAALGLRSTF